MRNNKNKHSGGVLCYACSTFIVPELWPFENLGILNLSAIYLRTIWARGLKLGQLIGDE